MPAKKKGLYANIHAKQERIKKGSGEKMRKPGTKGAPTKKAFDESEKTAKKSTARKSTSTAKKKAPAKTKSSTKKAASRTRTAAKTRTTGKKTASKKKR
jgi:hypothetical protein